MHRKSPLQFSLLALFLGLTLSSCLRDKEELTQISYTEDEMAVLAQSLNLPNPVYNYLSNDFTIDFPGRPFDNFTNSFDDVHNHQATLGRVLFYENKISENNAVACGSCHHQDHAFADPVAKSEGFNGDLTLRNSLSLGNVSGYGSHRFFWDERAHSVQEQTQMTMQDH
ncbi:MAG: cytochrome-c peroxidase, partial [Phaeodactylibacter sp.]|nr:cytochrome-c peroxidase [Phaeodactylibacter sp.]